MMDHREKIQKITALARQAAHALACEPAGRKNEGLHAIANALEEGLEDLLKANARDLEAGQKRGLSKALLDRLRLDEKRIATMVEGVRQVAGLTDPVGRREREWRRADGLHIEKVRVPIGVIGIIYESRPNVTVDAAVLCLKAGNATILRGGSEAFESNQALGSRIRHGLERAGLPPHAIQLVPFTDREGVRLLAEATGEVDLLIPRGGKGLIDAVVAHARVPMIKHYDGVCVAFLHAAADPAKAAAVIHNGKVQRPGVCNALETLLIDRETPDVVLLEVVDRLLAAGVELRCDEVARARLGDRVTVPAEEEDFQTEFLDLIMAVKVVDGVEAAIRHINTFGSHHSDVILTENAAVAERFLQAVDSATVYWNASTRFTDGGEFGFGAEIGISTDRLHARGPMGLEELTTYKYLLRGNGQVRG